jgi:DNA (cytosine-5)-methyltransferase 1
MIEVLEKIFEESINLKTFTLSNDLKDCIDVLIENIDSNKSLVSALVTSLLKKIIEPQQDVRYHRVDFEKGYSARSLDTKITVPFFKKHYPKYANKESSFLTLATRERIPWTLTEGDGMKIRNKAVKQSYLIIFDNIEKGTSPKQILLYLFSKLTVLSIQHQGIYDNAINETDFTSILNINTVLEMLKSHFSIPHGSRLPVIAIYSVYQEIFKQVKRYDNKILLPLNVHTSSDKHGFGDVEIWNNDNTPFEMVEIKHKIPIERNMIFDIAKKSQNTTIQRYYILTTSENNFFSDEEEKYINMFILQIKKDFGLEIIANGIIYTLKYYLRFIEDYNNFISSYTKNLIMDSKNSTEVKESHIIYWIEELKKHSILNIKDKN